MRSLSGWLAGITLGIAWIAIDRAFEADPTRAPAPSPRAAATTIAPPTSTTTTTPAVVWEKDPKAAARQAALEGKLVLTFFTLGDLGTGHC